jgi:hypothetical protein
MEPLSLARRRMDSGSLLLELDMFIFVLIVLVIDCFDLSPPLLIHILPMVQPLSVATPTQSQKDVRHPTHKHGATRHPLIHPDLEVGCQHLPQMHVEQRDERQERCHPHMSPSAGSRVQSSHLPSGSTSSTAGTLGQCTCTQSRRGTPRHSRWRSTPPRPPSPRARTHSNLNSPPDGARTRAQTRLAR